MTPIKIYYKDVPGHNLISSKDGAKVWTRNIRSLNEDYKSSIFPILDLLGIDYSFSQDKDSIALIDVGSLHPSSNDFFNICSTASNEYQKAIIFSTQEPWQWPHVEKILKTFNNLFLFDAGTPLTNNNVYHERYGNFPSFLCRMFTPRLHVTMVCGDDLSYRKDYKKLYSCLLARWRPEKHLLFSMLAYNNLIDNGYVTFNPLLKPREAEFLLTEQDTQTRIENFKDTINILMPYADQSFKDFTIDGIRNFEPVILDHDVFIDEAQFNSTISDRPPVKWFDPSLRAQPKFLFEESCFSLVCESFSGVMLGQDKDGLFEPINARSYITEKSITPILNGHPWLVFGEAGFNTTLESYGFVVHDELFDFSFDRNVNHGNRIEAIKNNMLSLNMNNLTEILWNQHSETNKKIRHNRHNLFHTQSKMWNMLRSNIKNIFDRVRELNV
jgi:hypothetical protein